jgi:hypothetical protein
VIGTEMKRVKKKSHMDIKTQSRGDRKSKICQTQSQERKERPGVEGSLERIKLFKEYLHHLNKYLYSFPVLCHGSSTVTTTQRSKHSFQHGNINFHFV